MKKNILNFFFRLSGVQNAMLNVNFSTFDAADSDCGNIKSEPTFNGRIIGGQEAMPHNYNWMVVLVLTFANGNYQNFQIETNLKKKHIFFEKCRKAILVWWKYYIEDQNC